jgi:hypothetical protein
MNRIEIRALIQERNDWCVSIIIPPHRTSPDRRVDTEVLRKAILQTKTILNSKTPPTDIYNWVTNQIDKLELGFDPIHAMEGMGLFVSPDMAKMVYFPFAVKERIMVGSTFELRDLYYLEQFAKPYYVLKLTKEEAHLFQLEIGTATHEVTNTYFPMRDESEYEYSKPSLGTSYGYVSKSFEKDKSVMSKARHEAFYKEVAQNVMPYTKAGDLIVSGAKNIISLFDSSRDKRLRVKGRIIGSFKDEQELFERARSTYFDSRQHEIQMTIDGLGELFGLRKVTYGIRNVETAAASGKGETLLVEKDFKKDEFILSGEHPSQSSINHNVDKVDQIINNIIDKGGKVIFTEANQLEQYDRIALVLRY